MGLFEEGRTEEVHEQYGELISEDSGSLNRATDNSPDKNVLFEEVEVREDVQGVDNPPQVFTYENVTNVTVGDVAGGSTARPRQTSIGDFAEESLSMEYLLIEHSEGTSLHKQFLVRGWEGKQ